MRGVDPSSLRRLNTSAVLRALAVEAGPISMTALAERTSLSRRTIELVLDGLVETGRVTELERVPTSGIAGRPPRRFELRADHAFLAAVRVTTLEATAIISDVRGLIVGRAQRLLPDYFNPASTLDLTAELVHLALESAGASLDDLRAGAVASGGAIDEKGVVRRLVNAERWVGIDLPAELGSRIPIAWFADNDANLGALAEHWRGAAKDHENIVWAILGARTGLGLLIRGSVHRGFEGVAGEIIEDVSLTPDAFDDRDVVMLTSPLAAERAEAATLYSRARAGDRAALAEVDEFVAQIGGILTTLSWTIAPSLIVLAGGLEDAADVLLPRVRVALRSARAPQIELRASTLGSDGPLVGALRFVLDRVDTELFGPLMPAVETRSTHRPYSGA